MGCLVKGILLAGGSGSRLGAITKVVGKSLLPIYDKPLIYYPLSTLLSAGVHQILVISTPRDTPAIEKLLGNRIGNVALSYAVQPEPRGIAEALTIGGSFLAGESCWLILGDNIFYGGNITELVTNVTKPSILVTRSKEAKRFGVVELDTKYQVRSIEEKPQHPKSDIVAAGMYFFDGQAYDIAKRLYPSARGELEITDVCNYYVQRGELTALGMHGVSWFDVGTHDAMLQASSFVKSMLDRGYPVGNIREIGVE